VVIASTKNSEYAGIAHEEKPIFGLSSPSYLPGPVGKDANVRCSGVQFHPELEHVRRPKEIH
jgi:hypothetical protein